MIYISFQRDCKENNLNNYYFKPPIFWCNGINCNEGERGTVFPPLIPEVKNDLFKNSHILNEFGFCPF